MLKNLKNTGAFLLGMAMRLGFFARRNAFLFLACAVLVTFLTGTEANAALVSYDDTSGVVTFDASAIGNPVVGAVIKGVLAGVGIVITILGVRWLIRAFKGTK